MIIRASLLLLPSGSAWAQDAEGEPKQTTDRTSAQLFRPNLDTGSFITLWDADAMRKWHFSVGLNTNYALRPLQFKTATDVDGDIIYEFTEAGLGPVDHLLVSQLYGAVGLTDFLTVAASIPVTLAD